MLTYTPIGILALFRHSFQIEYWRKGGFIFIPECPTIAFVESAVPWQTKSLHWYKMNSTSGWSCSMLIPHRFSLASVSC